jgi:hypothetical protein
MSRSPGPGRGGVLTTVAAGYREYYVQQKHSDPKFTRFPFAQSFLLVLGRTE